MRVVGKVNRVFTKVRKRLTSLTTVEVEMTESPVNPMYGEHNAGGSISDEQSKPTVNPLSLLIACRPGCKHTMRQASRLTFTMRKRGVTVGG